MQPTRQEMLSAIEHKIARTGGGTGPGETGYYLPVTLGDAISISPYCGNILVGDNLWRNSGNLEAQDDDCISYIFNLISHE